MLNTPEDQPTTGNSTNSSEVTIPAEVQPMINQIESQIAEIVKGFNQVFQDKDLPQATIADFQYIIKIPTSQKPTETVNLNMASRANEASSSREAENFTTTMNSWKMCCVRNEDGSITCRPCLNI
ncbi:hypothetical protein [Anabaena sp. CCY 0017]|uniref:hypothetical protein n=1 Tax=Anabaena sp. CCY 0017 TaxID=3103866 RepID=UPI0039C64532